MPLHTDGVYCREPFVKKLVVLKVAQVTSAVFSGNPCAPIFPSPLLVDACVIEFAHNSATRPYDPSHSGAGTTCRTVVHSKRRARKYRGRDEGPTTARRELYKGCVQSIVGGGEGPSSTTTRNTSTVTVNPPSGSRQTLCYVPRAISLRNYSIRTKTNERGHGLILYVSK